MGGCASKNVYKKPTERTLKEDRTKNKQFEENIKFIQNVPLFGRLHPSDVPLIVEALVLKVYAPGETVIKEGDKGDEFFLIRESQAVVCKGDVEIARLRAGDYFGETSLLEDTSRITTIKVLHQYRLKY